MVDQFRSSGTNQRTDKQPGGVTIGNVIGGIHNSIIAGRDVIVNVLTGSTGEQRAQRNRRAMLELVRNTWVKGVLEQSLYGAAMIELGLEERADAVEHPWDMVLQMPDRPARILSPGTRILDVFDEMNQALLILGEPGSGKTTMLLELARDTISRAERGFAQPIPVVFNLSSWAEKRQPIADWLVEEMNAKYHVPKSIARPWVENNDLLLLLDGLDEVGLEYREACAKAINDFRGEYGLTPLAVCSRIADYEALTTRLKLQGAVLLQPLTPQQVEQYLDGTGTELSAVRRTLQHDTTLQELARSPLMLSIMALAYRGMLVTDLRSLDTMESRRKHLFDAYMRQMFKRRIADQPYSPERTIQWLAWLAQEMLQHAQMVLLIERIQPDWLQKTAQQRLYAVGWSLIVSLLGWGGIGVGLALICQQTLLSALVLVYGLIYGLAYGLTCDLKTMSFDVESIGVIKWSWRTEALSFGPVGVLAGVLTAWMLIGGVIVGLGHAAGPVTCLASAFIAGLVAWLVFGLICSRMFRGLRRTEVFAFYWRRIHRPTSGLLGGLLGGLALGVPGWILSSTELGRLIPGPIGVAIGGLVGGLVSGLVGGLVFWLVIALVVGEVGRLSYVELETSMSSGQGVRRSLRRALGMGGTGGLISGMAGMLIGSLVSGLSGGLIGGLSLVMILGLPCGLYFGGTACIQHFVVRSILYLKGHMPWNYACFLDYATERIFLRKVGGGYMFIHRLLQDYFASLYQGQ